MSGPAQRPAPIPRFEYCEVAYRKSLAAAFVDIVFYEQERGAAIRHYEPSPAAIAALGMAGWRLVCFDLAGDMWFMRPWLPGRAIDDIHIIAPKVPQGHKRSPKQPKETSEES